MIIEYHDCDLCGKRFEKRGSHINSSIWGTVGTCVIDTVGNVVGEPTVQPLYSNVDACDACVAAKRNEKTKGANRGF